MPEAKKPRLAEDSKSTSDTFNRVLEEFTDVQDKLQQLTMKMSEEGLSVVRRICQQYNALREPYFESRRDLLKKLPKFWSSVCQNHPLVSAILTIDDTEILDCLQDVWVREFEDRECGFKVEFEFSRNPFFEENRLIKSVSFTEEGTMVITSTPPTWKENMAPAGEQSAEEKSKRKQDRTYNFFLWFEESGTMDPGVQDQMSLIFKDDIWPNPMRYYSNPGQEVEQSKEMEIEVDELAFPAEVTTEDVLPVEPIQKERLGMDIQEPLISLEAKGEEDSVK